MENIFLTRNLHKTFHVGEVAVRALKGVDLAIGEGEFVVILGPSGSGKSTLLNILGGMDTPTEGEILYRGRYGNQREVDSPSGYCCVRGPDDQLEGELKALKGMERVSPADSNQARQHQLAVEQADYSQPGRCGFYQICQGRGLC